MGVINIAQVNIRIDDKLKEEADLLFGTLGISFSSAVSMFISQAVREQAIPFHVAVNNMVTQIRTQSNNELRNFLDEQGRLKRYPAKRKRQIYALIYLASKFERDRLYTEIEINHLISSWHTFNDWALLRRDLLDSRFLNRKKDGSEYWLNEPLPTLASFGFE
jgi:addiction module RelB/DinJ family antitoxin